MRRSESDRSRFRRGHLREQGPDKAGEFAGEGDGHLRFHDTAVNQVPAAFIKSGLYLPTQLAIRGGLAALAHGHFAKDGWTIVARGLSYGFALDLEVHSPDGRHGSFGVLIPKGKAMEVRQGYQRGQLGDISSAARCLREYGEDFLRGEWSRFEEIDRFHREIRKATHDAWQKEQKEAPLRYALEEAGEAFRRQDYNAIVDVLSPFFEVLSPTQRKKLEFAKKKKG